MSNITLYENEVELTNDSGFLNLEVSAPSVSIGSEQGESMIITDLDSMISFFKEGLEMLLNKRDEIEE